MSDDEITDDYIQNLISQASNLLQKKDEFSDNVLKEEVKEVKEVKPKQKRFLSDEAKERARERLRAVRQKAQEIKVMKNELKNTKNSEILKEQHINNTSKINQHDDKFKKNHDGKHIIFLGD